MKYTDKQIATAKSRYFEFIQYKCLEDVNIVGMATAEQRMEFHNSIVSKIKGGDVDLEREWKLFFLNEQVEIDAKALASSNKIKENRKNSSSVLAPIKELKKIGAFGKWLNTKGNNFRKQHFNKKYTEECVSAFLLTL